ncbi:hypothetical protein ABZ354_14680 [Streptomyces sp. NPDC005925]|uniref:hypothetical protein n=1 Tax=Streptomyces sp. NPDC005925 TaxID=3157172 RepID=UPI0033CBA8E3
MSGRPWYWNEDAQRWEDGTDATAPAAPPPPPRPEFLPPVPAAPPAGGPGSRSGPEVPDGGPRLPGCVTKLFPPTFRWPGGPPAWGVLGGAVAVGVAVALVLTLVVKDGDGDGTRDDKAASASASPTGDDPSGGTSPSGTATGLPADFELYLDAQGFTIARPRDWTRETTDSEYGIDIVDYRSEDGFRRLQVYEVAESSPAASFDLFLSDETRKAKGFEEVALKPLDAGDITGVRLEYRADSFRGEADADSWHVQDVRFRSPDDGKVYAIAAYGASTDGADPELDLALTALTHFCPPDTYCG